MSNIFSFYDDTLCPIFRTGEALFHPVQKNS